MTRPLLAAAPRLLKAAAGVRGFSRPSVVTMTCFVAWILVAATFAPAADDVVRSARDGVWSNASTWTGGKAPGAGAKVQVRTGHVVTYDVSSDAVIRTLHVAGTLRFAPDRDTLLNVGLIRIQSTDDFSEDGFDCDAHVPEIDPSAPRATLEVGAADHPIEAGRTATIRLHYLPGMDRNSAPAIVCCAGRMEFHGAPLGRTWAKLGATANDGDAAVTLAEAATGWRVGDRVLITATEEAHKFYGSRRPGSDAVAVQSEERTIVAIGGAQLTLDKPLSHRHLGDGEFRGEAANLSRNVVVESADPAGVRGHTMYHRGSAGSISYAEFRHLGKEGVLGRYALHYHHCGDTMRGSSVVGASIHDSHNRWLTFDNVRRNPLIQISDDNPSGAAVSHFRNVPVVNRPKDSNDALVNRGVSPRPEPTTPRGVPVYLHDHFGPGRHAKIVSTQARDLAEDGNAYVASPPLTGDESRVAEVRDVAFPELLDPVDDLPPTTVITSVGPRKDGRTVVRGVAADNGTVRRVTVNGREAKATAANFAEWEAVLDDVDPTRVALTARAEDAAGNVEQTPHVVPPTAGR